MFLAIAISIAILIAFQFLLPGPPPPKETAQHVAQQHVASSSGAPPAATAPSATPAPGAPGASAGTAGTGSLALHGPVLTIDAPRVEGSINLEGATIDNLVLRDYRETIKKNSPQVQLLIPPGAAKPTYVQFGWSAAPGENVRLPNDKTIWSAPPGTLSPRHPVTLSWDNGQGLVFHLGLTVDDNYMFRVVQSVTNNSGQAVALYPWSRVRRGYTPKNENTYLSHEGLLGVLDGTLHEYQYDNVKKKGAGEPGGVAHHFDSTGGWAGITDKYWLVALIPSQKERISASIRHLDANGHDHYQVDVIATEPEHVAPGASVTTTGHLFAGAKLVDLLDRYQAELQVPHLDKAVDFGYFYIVTKPVFFMLDWLNQLLGNFGLAIMAFTIIVRAVFFPLANKSYRSMNRMRMLQPKMKAIKDRLKDDPQQMQKETMALYKAEGVNPASGCLPMLVQVPIFWALYKVLYITIEMRQAPFFGWIHDLSAPDPTNIFNLFGLIPFDPVTLSPFLQLGAWPLIMGITMFLQQRLNPTPPDPMQAKLFLLMPIVFTFMLAHFPVGLVIYYSWNNLLSLGQQWLIMRQMHDSKPKLARS